MFGGQIFFPWLLPLSNIAGLVKHHRIQILSNYSCCYVGPTALMWWTNVWPPIEFLLRSFNCDFSNDQRNSNGWVYYFQNMEDKYYVTFFGHYDFVNVLTQLDSVWSRLVIPRWSNLLQWKKNNKHLHVAFCHVKIHTKYLLVHFCYRLMFCFYAPLGLLPWRLYSFHSVPTVHSSSMRIPPF